MTAVLMAVNMLLGTIQAENFAMDYLRFGNGARNLVIIPGTSVQSVMMSAQAIADSYKLLTEDFTVYVLDRRKDMPESYTVYDMARDTAEAVKALKLGRVRLFGTSQGGMIAMKIAIDYPELVESMILGSTSAKVTQETYRRVFAGWAELAEAGKAEELYLSFGKALFPASVFEQSRELFIEAAKTVTPNDLKRFVTITEGMKGFDVTGDLNKIKCPVLVIGSNSDKIFGGEASAKIMEAIKGKPNCELFMYDGYGHAVYDLAPDYRERMLKFLVP
ncbi:MAG: alpha/beta hydrolase [Synergistaceae bacterium]|nr:alpha/beta hydrolase [Synergistaceae bacterium]